MTAATVINIDRQAQATPAGPHIYTLDTARESTQALIADMSRRAVMNQHNAQARDNTERMRDRSITSLDRVEQQLREQLDEVQRMRALIDQSSKLFQV